MLPVRLGASTGCTGLGDFCEDRLELKDGIGAKLEQAHLEIQEGRWRIRQNPWPAGRSTSDGVVSAPCRAPARDLLLTLRNLDDG
jgi:hypothetical protein